jgi:hypothetical protein
MDMDKSIIEERATMSIDLFGSTIMVLFLEACKSVTKLNVTTDSVPRLLIYTLGQLCKTL